MTETAETWELTSGLPDDFNVEVTDAWFATDSRYNNGQTTILFWKGTTDHDEMPEMDGEIRFACGADWESLDGGLTVEHPKGKTKFNNQSAIGNLIARAIELGAGGALMAKGTAQEASVWVGTKWHMKREGYDYQIQGGEKKHGERLLPDAYNGADGEGGTSEAKTSAPEKGTDSILGDLDPALVETLKKAKADTANHMAFVDAAMELTEVTGNSTLVMALAAEDGLYQEL